MAVNRGYARQTRNGIPIAHQLDALRAAGVEVDGKYAPVYVDRLPDRRAHRTVTGDALPNRAAVLADLRPGARLVVAGLDRLGVSAGDIRAVIDTLIDRGCSVHDAVAGATFDAETPRADLSAATLAAEALLKAERVRKARSVRAERLAAGLKAAAGGNKAWNPTPEAEQDWRDLSLTQAQVAERHGVAPITLRRKFGARDAPRGRRPKKQPIEDKS